jgi:predicted RNA-binding protein associated with RNAse of E/G family
MRKKLTSKTYLRDVDKYIVKFDLSNDDYYIIIKKILSCKPFILESGLKLMDNNYYMLELIPKLENYTMRVFFDNNKKILLYYFDITLENGIDEETKVPFYDDLFLDVVVIEGKIELLDEDELIDAFEKRAITKADIDLAYKAKDKLINELKNRTNKFMNMNLKDVLKDM